MLINIVVLAPFIGSAVLGIAYLNRVNLKITQNTFAALGMSAPLISLICMGIILFDGGASKSVNLSVFNWISAGSFEINIGFYLDKLSVIMGFFVLFLATLIHFYSIGYMDKDPGFGKFFSYMNLFLGSMLVLVLANSPIFMFVGWEGVGVCSYLLISFYFDGKDNVKAGNKAFILNRIGDFGFVIGLVTLYIAVGRSGFDYDSLASNISLISPNLAIFIGSCFICGALAKSAQIPLYTWLPDAMAGPTPISALIHAATMVTAGVYMVIRFDFLYGNLSSVLEVLALIGVFSALFAAVIATKATDIKKILAYSTMSQLGYMFAALSYASGASLFHLFTHGFFKALLFLGAGSVIIALHHEQNIFKMGSLRKNRVLFYPMLIGSLAISGIFPFSGFFSKDAIILNAFLSGHYLIGATLLFVAGLTSYYVFRLFFLVFYSKNVAPKAHKVPPIMTFVNVVLSFLVLFGGVLMLALELPHVSLMAEIIAGVISLSVSFLGIFIAYKKFFYYENKKEQESKFEIIVANKFYIDEIYDALFVRTFASASKFITGVLDKAFYSTVLNLALAFKFTSKIYAKFTQTGLTNSYAFYMVLWICIIVIYIKVDL